LQARYNASKEPARNLEVQRPSERANKRHVGGFTRADLLPQGKDFDEWDEFEKICRRDQELDVFLWWENNKARFPTLYGLAKQYLTIPATSASSERQFSKAQRLKTKKRYSLKAQKLSSMVVVCENRESYEEVVALRKSCEDSSSDRTSLSREPSDNITDTEDS
jgi:hypothetical protein